MCTTKIFKSNFSNYFSNNFKYSSSLVQVLLVIFVIFPQVSFTRFSYQLSPPTCSNFILMSRNIYNKLNSAYVYIYVRTLHL